MAGVPKPGIGQAWRACGPTGPRGFKSHPRRSIKLSVEQHPSLVVLFNKRFFELILKLTASNTRIEALKKAHRKEKGAVKLAEEYLEAVYEIFQQNRGRVRPVDIARALNVAPSTVKKVILRLSEKGYVRYEPYRLLELTKEGLSNVQKLKRRHDSLSMLLQTLGMDEMTAEMEAERMEHSISDKSTMLFEALGEVLRENEELGRAVRESVMSKLMLYEKR